MKEPNQWKSIIMIYYFIQVVAVFGIVFFLIGLGVIAFGYGAPDNFINYVLSNLSK